MRPIPRRRPPGRRRAGGGGRALQGPGHQWRWPISRAEAQAAPALAAHFDEIDANKDGQITPKEFRAYHRTLKDARPRARASAAAPPAPSPSWTRTATAS
jgi:hypothetical protein